MLMTQHAGREVHAQGGRGDVGETGQEGEAGCTNNTSLINTALYFEGFFSAMNHKFK